MFDHIAISVGFHVGKAWSRCFGCDMNGWGTCLVAWRKRSGRVGRMSELGINAP